MQLKNLQNLEKLINSELASKIQSSKIDNQELLIEVGESDLINVIQFLKSNDFCKFRHLIWFIYYYRMNIIIELNY